MSDFDLDFLIERNKGVHTAEQVKKSYERHNKGHDFKVGSKCFIIFWSGNDWNVRPGKIETITDEWISVRINDKRLRFKDKTLADRRPYLVFAKEQDAKIYIQPYLQLIYEALDYEAFTTPDDLAWRWEKAH